MVVGFAAGVVRPVLAVLPMLPVLAVMVVVVVVVVVLFARARRGCRRTAGGVVLGVGGQHF